MRLYFKYLKLHFKSAMQYKTSFLLSFISQAFAFLGFYITILCLFNKFPNVAGFNMYEVLLTFSIISFGSSFCEIFFRGIDQFDHLIEKGEFDRLLLKPKNILFQVIVEEADFVRSSRLLQSIIFLIIALVHLKIKYNLLKILILILMLSGSIIVFFGLLVLSAAYCFITIKGLEVRNVFTCGCRDMAQYPIGIFSRGMMFFLTYIIPFGCINYYPLLYLLGKSNNTLYIFTPLLTIIYLIPCIIIFYKGIKKYTSTGS